MINHPPKLLCRIMVVFIASFIHFLPFRKIKSKGVSRLFGARDSSRISSISSARFSDIVCIKLKLSGVAAQTEEEIFKLFKTREIPILIRYFLIFFFENKFLIQLNSPILIVNKFFSSESNLRSPEAAVPIEQLFQRPQLPIPQYILYMRKIKKSFGNKKPNSVQRLLATR